MMYTIYVCLFMIIFNYYTSCESINITIPLCTDGNVCDNFTNTDLFQTVESTTVENENETLEEYFDFDVTILPQPMHIISKNQSSKKIKNSVVHKMKSDVCLCDLTISSCDINCCCDNDCNDFHLHAFSHCKENDAKIYDSRYCYKQNFIVRNNTKFIHNKIADNLFCIAYDNLPPKYNPTDNIVYGVGLLKKEISIIKKSVEKWQWSEEILKPVINITNPYTSGELLWKFQGKFIKPFELPQTGFSGHCTLKKSIVFLEDWKESCFQNILSNQNKQLFVKSYNNFSLLSSPLLLKNAYMITNQTCSKDVCVPLTTYYCENSWNLCTTKETRAGFCINQTCENVIKSVKYLIRHNGTAGIIKVATFFKLANISSAFYQQIEVEFAWIDSNKDNIVKRSGNPGYILGGPIIIGTSQIITSTKKHIKQIVTNRENRYLSLALAGRNGECKDSMRYDIEFGQDAKTSCIVVLKTNNFTSNSCQKIQNQTFEVMFKDFVWNYTERNPSRIYASKFGSVSNNISNWVQTLFDKIPKNSAKGYIFQDEIKCENIVTSMKVHILYSLISKPEGTNNHMILGVWIEISNETTVTWPKCSGSNCLDALKITMHNYVSFHDASKLSKYRFAVGPNIDIRLPYDFFYPFINNSSIIQPSFILLSFIIALLECKTCV